MIGGAAAASLVNVAIGVLLARIMVPEKKGVGGFYAAYGSLLKYDSSIDAISKGTMDGLTVALNISAILIVFVSFVAIANGLLGVFPDVAGAPVSVERILGVVFAPLAWLIGVEWSEAPPRPMVFWKTKPKPRVIHFRIFQCHSRADRAEMTRISGRTWKAKTKSALSLVTS